jgi:hypothetical protein
MKKLLRPKLQLVIFFFFFAHQFANAQWGAGAASFTIYNKPQYGAFLNNTNLTVTRRAAIAKDSLRCDLVRSQIVTSTWTGSSNTFNAYDAQGLDQWVVLLHNNAGGGAHPFVTSAGRTGYGDTVRSILLTYPQIHIIAVENEEFTTNFNSGPMTDYGGMLQTVYPIAHALGVAVTDGGLTGVGMAIKTYRYVVAKYGQTAADQYGVASGMSTTQINAAKTKNSNASLEAQANQIDTVFNYSAYVDFWNMHGYEVFVATNSPDTITKISPNVYRYTAEFITRTTRKPVVSNEVGQRFNVQALLTTNMLNEFYRLGIPKIIWYNNFGTLGAQPLTDTTTGALLPSGVAFVNFLHPGTVIGGGGRYGNQDSIRIPISNGQFATALVLVPDDYLNNSNIHPLIIGLVGAAKYGTQAIKLTQEGLGEAIFNRDWDGNAMNTSTGILEKFIAVSILSPYSTQSLTNSDMTLAMSWLYSHYRVDTLCVGGTGPSRGGAPFAWYAAHILSANPCISWTFFNPKHLFAAIMPMSAEINQCDPVDSLVTDSVGVWAFGSDTTGSNDSHAIATHFFVDHINAIVPNFARFTNYTCTDGCPNKCGHGCWPQFLKATYTESFNGVSMNVYQFVLSKRRKAKVVAIKNKRIYLNKASDNTVSVNSTTYPYNPGDSFVLRASAGPYSSVAFRNLDSFNVINEGGQVVDSSFATNPDGSGGIAGGFSFYNCTHWHVIGSGAAGVKYGFLFKTDFHRGVGIQVYGRSAWGEVDHCEINNKNAGFWIKEESLDNNCDSNYGFPKWVLHDFKLHDNYIHNTSAEGMYLGSTAPNGTTGTQHPSVWCFNNISRTDSVAGAVPDTILPMRLGKFDIYNNIIDSTGRGAIQLSDADSGVSHIHNNRLTHIGLEFNSDQGNAIITGTYTRAIIDTNFINKTFTAGIHLLGSYSYVHDNFIDSSGYLAVGHTATGASIEINDPTANIPSPGHTNPDSSTFIIQNNTVGAHTDGVNVRVYNSNPNQWTKKNVICSSGTFNVPAGIIFSTVCGTGMLDYKVNATDVASIILRDKYRSYFKFNQLIK